MKKIILETLVAIIGFFLVIVCLESALVTSIIVAIPNTKIAIIIGYALIAPLVEESYKTIFRKSNIIIYGFIILEAVGYVILNGAPIHARLLTAIMHISTILIIQSEKGNWKTRLCVAIAIHGSYNGFLVIV